jgi:peptidoglycan/xylan/chitin deacetylase (PgdA/CDA1 family)
MAGAGLRLAGWPKALRAAPARLYCPILMYHYISEVPAGADALRRDLTVTPAQFAGHLDYLAGEGFTAVTLAHLASALRGEAVLPPKAVVLTFDDGYDDAFANAYPALAERGMTGVFFVVSGFMEQAGYLSWAQAAEMKQAGLEIGSHSATHPNLIGLSHEALMAEVEGSAVAIEEMLGERPVSFCYPLGRCDAGVIRAVRGSGYLAAVTTADGTLHSTASLYRLRRVRVRGRTSTNGLAWLVDRQI